MNAVPQPATSVPQPFAAPQLASALLEQWPGAALVLDHDLQVCWLNRRAQVWLQVRAESLVQRPWTELPLPWRLERAVLEQALRGAEMQLAPAAIVGAAGAVRHCALRLAPLQLEAGVSGVLLTLGEACTSGPWQIALECARGGTWEQNAANGPRIFADEIYRLLLGVDPQAARTDPAFWSSRLHPEDVPLLERIRQGVYAGLTDAFEAEYRLRHASGSWVWVLDRGRVVERDKDRRPRRVVGFMIDISRHKLADQALLESEQRFQLATEAVHGMIYEVDSRSGHVQRYGLERLLGYPPDEVGASEAAWVELVHPEDRQCAIERFLEARRSGTSVEFQYRVRHRDGHYVHVWDRAVMLRDEQGQVMRYVGFTMDVSEQVRNQEALRRSELLYRSIAALSPGFVFESRIDAAGRAVVVSASEGFEQIYGCSIEEFERAGGWDAFVDWESITPALRKARNLPTEFQTGDARVRTAHGESKWLFITSQPRFDASGRIAGYIGSALDITERKLAEETLRQSQLQLQTMADASPSWLMLADREQRCLFVNRGIGDLQPGDMTGRRIEDFTPPADRSRVREILQRVLDTGEPGVYDLRIDSPERGRRFYDCRARAVREGAEIGGVAIAMSDVTDLRLSEDILRTQGRILEHMVEGVALIDGANVIQLTNPAFERMFGFPTGMLVGRPVGPLLRLSEAQRVRLGRRLHEGSQDGSVAGVELDCSRRDGTSFVAFCVITPIDVAGQEHWLAVLSDVTERKRLEHEILEIANREQQRIGSDLHDGLGQELTGVALMLRGISAQLRRERSTARADVEHVIGLVNAAIESTRDLARGLSPVNEHCGGLRAALQSLADRSKERYGIAAELTSRLKTPLLLDEGDATHLYRIAQEAITNAIRHGRVTRIAIELEAGAERVCLTIRDNGRGFDARRSTAGGMGLKIMHYRSQMLHGELTVRSAPGEGVEVRCECPHRAASDGATPGRRRHASRRARAAWA